MGAISSLIRPEHYIALKNRNFRILALAKYLLVSAIVIQEVSISYYIYTVTKDPLSLGLIGLVEAVPFISVVLFGGYFADKISKKQIIKYFLGIMLLVSLSLAIASFQSEALNISETLMLLLCYLTLFVYGLCRAFVSPAIDALRIFVLEKKEYSNAATWWSATWQGGSIVSPGIAGLIYAYFGFKANLLLVCVLLLIGTLTANQIKEPKKASRQNEKSNEKFFKNIKEGLTYVYRNKVILYAISLDLFSVLFGGVVAILPVYATEILHVGAEGFGLLRMASSAGAIIALGVMIFASPNRNKPWRNLMVAVASFGIFTLVFAVSKSFWLSWLALFLAGAADSVSVVIRYNILQFLTPDDMRGRVHSINSIFLSSSNELGAFESGLAAKLMGPVQSVVFGGVACLGVVGYVAWKSKEFFNIDLEAMSPAENTAGQAQSQS